MHGYQVYIQGHIESEMKNESISISLVFTFHFFIFDFYCLISGFLILITLTFTYK